MDDRTMVGRTSVVLDVIAAHGALSLGALSMHSRLPRSTAYRIAEELCLRGIMRKRNNSYLLGVRLVGWGLHAQSENEMCGVASPYLEEIHHRTHEFVWLHQVFGQQIVLVDRTVGPTVPKVMMSRAWPDRLHRAALLQSASGQAAMAGRMDLVESLLEEGAQPQGPLSGTEAPGVRKAMNKCLEVGYAVEQGGFIRGWGCVAAPITETSGTVIGVIGVTGRCSTFSPAAHARCVLAAAQAISTQLQITA